jgi:hypothetical protein
MTTSYIYSYEKEMLTRDVMKHFDFLIDKFNYVKLPEYQYVREVHNDFIGQKIVIKLNYEGSFMLEILKPKFEINKLLSSVKRTVDYDYRLFDSYDLNNLDLDKEIYNSVSNDNFPDKALWYYSKLLKENPEIIMGDLTKLKWKFRLLKLLKFK